MLRKIIKIDKELCNGCGLCVEACHEGAILMEHGIATLKRDDYCDGLGDCLPICPRNAISFEEREALAYDELAVKAHQEKRNASSRGCPSIQGNTIPKQSILHHGSSQLQQWPIQIKLVPVQAAFFQDAKILIAADCSAYAYAKFHQEFMKDKITCIGCPKLDAMEYSEKLTEIFTKNDIQSIQVVRMDVPCCVKMERAVQTAIANSGKNIPCHFVTITKAGEIASS